ncbi:MAG: hypothetical protein IJC17_04735 [Clostridia bacterium]|nr:hypothetical protein [Clostridia bacterium]
MYKNKEAAYQKMLQAYSEYKVQYEQWAQQRKSFQQRYLERRYWYQGSNVAKKRTMAGRLLLDFPHVSYPEACEQIGGKKELIWQLGLWSTPHDTYWIESVEKWRIYDRLRHFPNEIYDAIKETYKWSKKLCIRTTLIEQYIPEIIEDIGRGLIF